MDRPPIEHYIKIAKEQRKNHSPCYWTQIRKIKILCDYILTQEAKVKELKQE